MENFPYKSIFYSEFCLNKDKVYRRDRYDYANAPYGGSVLSAIHHDLSS